MKVYLKEEKTRPGFQCHFKCYWFGKNRKDPCVQRKSPYGCKDKDVYFLRVPDPSIEKDLKQLMDNMRYNSHNLGEFGQAIRIQFVENILREYFARKSKSYDVS